MLCLVSRILNLAQLDPVALHQHIPKMVKADTFPANHGRSSKLLVVLVIWRKDAISASCILAVDK